MGLNLKNEHLYEVRKPKTYADKLSALAKQYLNQKYKEKQTIYFGNADNFCKSFMGVPNPFLMELKNYTLQEIVVRDIVDSLSRETLNLVREEFTARVCKVEANDINVVRIDNNQDKLAIMYEEKLDILKAGKSQLLNCEVFKFNNGNTFNNDTTVAEYLNELCYEMVMSDAPDNEKQANFFKEVNVLFSEFLKAYSLGIKKKHQFKHSFSMKGVLIDLEVRNEVVFHSTSEIVRKVYKDSFMFDEDF
ncbi:site-specific integrase [Pseudomonas haemolytica]|jgi:hypothetical protein|uniref:Uncharacterized protein n=1 Tax=Pseudomonas haemolytica TaxID=2600065 RepID=A0ABS1H0C6_9PSED|nr:hypothetical protein [Pseudomonas haemolytica]MBK3462650.1 hypothetical protein [Pseudomonas haemolytica]